MATSIALVVILAGCGGSATADEPTGALAIVVGARSNMPSSALTGRAATARDLAVSQRSYFSLVVADGAPYVADSGNLAVDADTAAAQQDQRDANRQRLDDAVAAARAETPETDLVAAIEVAAASIASQPGHRTILVLDSGLSSTGALDLTQPHMLDAVPQEIADTLGKFDQLPAVRGMSVLFSGLGNTAAPQEPLDPVRRAQLAAMWTAIVTTAGASSVEVESSPASAAPPADLPPVTPVTVTPGYSCSGDTMTLEGGGVAFRHDTHAFVAPSTVEEVLRPVAEQMKAGQLSAVVQGMTADTLDPDEQRVLTASQAQRVADVLVESGVPREQLAVVGLGSEFAGRVPERDAAGHLIPAAAAANRKVVITFSGPVTCG